MCVCMNMRVCSGSRCEYACVCVYTSVNYIILWETTVAWFTTDLTLLEHERNGASNKHRSAEQQYDGVLAMK